jgi:hypothetical protein
VISLNGTEYQNKSGYILRRNEKKVSYDLVSDQGK